MDKEFIKNFIELSNTKMKSKINQVVRTINDEARIAFKDDDFVVNAEAVINYLSDSKFGKDGLILTSLIDNEDYFITADQARYLFASSNRESELPIRTFSKNEKMRNFVCHHVFQAYNEKREPIFIKAELNHKLDRDYQFSTFETNMVALIPLDFQAMDTAEFDLIFGHDRRVIITSDQFEYFQSANEDWIEANDFTMQMVQLMQDDPNVLEGVKKLLDSHKGKKE